MKFNPCPDCARNKALAEHWQNRVYTLAVMAAVVAPAPVIRLEGDAGVIVASIQQKLDTANEEVERLKRLLDCSSRDPSLWKKEPPTEPGWYRCCRSGHPPAVTLVEAWQGSLVIESPFGPRGLTEYDWLWGPRVEFPPKALEEILR